MKNNNMLRSLITLSRNVEGNKYPHLLNEKEGRALTQTISKVIKDLGDYSIFDLKNIPVDIENEYLVKGYITMPLINNSNFSGFAISKDNKCRVHINSDNHIELNVVNDTLSLKDDFDSLNALDDEISKVIKYDFDERLGYLTSNVSTVGTGLKVYIDLFMPAVVYLNKLHTIFNMLSKVGVNIVDVSKEYMMDGVFRISNTVTLGKKEEQILTLMENTANKLLDIEKDASEVYLKNNISRVKDSVYKAFGILTNSYYVTDEEFAKYISRVKFGANMGLISFDNPIDFSKILLECNSEIIKNKCSTDKDETIYISRAEYLSKNMSNIKR